MTCHAGAPSPIPSRPRRDVSPPATRHPCVVLPLAHCRPPPPPPPPSPPPPPPPTPPPPSPALSASPSRPQLHSPSVLDVVRPPLRRGFVALPSIQSP